MKINSLLISMFVFFVISANGLTTDSIQQIDTFENPDYIGYRIALVDLSSSLTKNGNQIKINFTAINTGRKDLLFGKKIASPPSLVINFDDSVHNNQLDQYKEEIRAAINGSDFFVAAGKISKKQSILISKKKIEVIPEEIEEEIVEEPVLVISEIEDTPEKIVQAVSEEPKIEIEKEPEPEVFTAKEVVLPDNIEKPVVQDKPAIDEDACSDLVFENIRIVKKTKSKVTLEYTIINQGQGPAKLISNRKKENKNMALQAYISSKDKVTKSSFTFGGDFLQKGLKESNGKLYPGEKYTGTLKLNIQKMTKFTPYIILELDPYLSVFECDKKNNKLGIRIKN